MSDSETEDCNGFDDLPTSYYETQSDLWIARNTMIMDLELDIAGTPTHQEICDRELEQSLINTELESYLDDISDSNTPDLREEIEDQEVVPEELVGQKVVHQETVEQVMVHQEVVDQEMVDQEVLHQGVTSWRWTVLHQELLDQEMVGQVVVHQEMVDQEMVGQDMVGQEVVHYETVEQVVVQQEVVHQEVVDQEMVDQEVLRQEMVDQEVLHQEMVDQVVVQQEMVDNEVVHQEAVHHETVEQVVVHQEVVDQEMVDQEMEDQEVLHQETTRKRNVKQSARCGKCKGCNQEEDCRNCVSCRDMSRYGGPGKMKAGCRKKICTNPLKKTRCSQCEGCLTIENCLNCIPCKDMAKQGGSGKVKGGCSKKICSDPLWLSKVALQERGQEQSQALTMGAGGDQAEEIRLEREDLGFATTPGFTPFPARIDTKVSIGSRILINFYLTGEGAFISRTDWSPYSEDLVKQFLENDSVNRGGFGRALGELQSDLAFLDGVEVTRPSTTSNTMLGAPRRLGPVSRQGLMEEGPFNTAAFEEKMFLQKRKWCCRQCPGYQAVSKMEAERHARSCGQRPKEPRTRKAAVKFACSATSCVQKFASIKELNSHYRKAHPEHCRPRRCPECRKVYVDEVALKAHLKTVHGNGSGRETAIFSCPYCDYTSSRKFNLETRHVPLKHPALSALSTEDNRSGENLIEINESEDEDQIIDEEGDQVISDHDDDEEEAETVVDPILKTLNSQIQELRSRYDELHHYELLLLGNLEERREKWKQQMKSQPMWIQEFEKQPPSGGRKKKRPVGMDQVRTRKSTRLMAGQLTDGHSLQDLQEEQDQDRQEDPVLPDQQMQQEMMEREQLMVDEREVERDHVENTLIAANLVAYIVDCSLGEKFKCAVCKHVFNDKHHLEQLHFKVMHTPGPTPIPCTKDYCREDFPTKYEMEQHRKTCTFICPNCSKVITKCGRIVGHLKRCTGLG